MTLKGHTRDPNMFRAARKLLELEPLNLVCSFVLGMPSRRTNNFPKSGRDLGHVTPTILLLLSVHLYSALGLSLPEHVSGA